MEGAASIFLRADIRREDGQNMIQWVENHNVTRYLNEYGDIAEQIKTMLARTPDYLLTYYFNRDGQFYLVCMEDDRSIGFVKLCGMPHETYEVVYAIGEEALWGRGLGHQAFMAALNKAFFEKRARYVDAKIYNSNNRSICIARHCGMRVVAQRGNLSVYRVTLDEYLNRPNAVRA